MKNFRNKEESNTEIRELELFGQRSNEINVDEEIFDLEPLCIERDVDGLNELNLNDEVVEFKSGYYEDFRKIWDEEIIETEDCGKERCKREEAFEFDKTLCVYEDEDKNENEEKENEDGEWLDVSNYEIDEEKLFCEIEKIYELDGSTEDDFSTILGKLYFI